MKTSFLLFILVLSTGAFAQRTGDIVVFNNSGYQFHVSLNGITQNEKAETNLRIKGLEGPYYNCLVIADDNTFSISKNVIVKTDTLITYQLVGKKGKFKLRFFSEVPMAKAPQSSIQAVVLYHSTESTPTIGTTSTVSTPTTMSTTTSVGTPSGQSTSTTISTSSTMSSTSTTTSGNASIPNSGTESVSISMNVGENGVNVNMSGTGLEGSEMVAIEMNGMGGTGTTTSNYQETTTTTYTETINGVTTSSETTVTTSGGIIPPTEFTEPEFTETEIRSTSTETVPTSNCYISDTEAATAIQLIKDENFADDQLILAKTLVSKKCLNISQVGQIADAIAFEDNRLEFVKAAYTTCLDRSSYYQLLSKFNFSQNKEELKRFIDAN